MRLVAALAAFAALQANPAPGWTAGPIAIVAAENFYGDVAQQIGGAQVKVTSVLSNPDQDPHLFEASPSVARDLSAAQLVILNGAGYDPWMVKLLAAARRPGRRTVVVADLVGTKDGGNPHIWYDPATMLALAKTLTEHLASVDPAHRADYQDRLSRFQQSLQPIEAGIATLREHQAGTPVTATEPVLGDMFAALGVQVRNLRFQLAVMNNTEPSASDVAAFESDLKTRAVRLLAYNSQASGPIARRMRELAQAFHVPVVGVTETEPSGMSYQAWMLSTLDAVDRALAE